MKIRRMVFDLSDLKDAIDEIDNLYEKLEEELKETEDDLEVGRVYCKYLEGLLEKNNIEFDNEYF